MTTRWGLGPVFAFEWLVTSRRWQVYALRSLFVTALLAGLALAWRTSVADQRFTTIQALAALGQAFYNAIVSVALAMVLLAAPAATAGSICLDKARGTLDHLLATDLSDAEIVLGKLGARLVPTIGLVGCALPVMALGTLLGGIDPEALMGAFLVLFGIAILGAALALTLSVWGRKTHEVLMATYVVWLVWLFALPVLEWVARSSVSASLRNALAYSHPVWLVFAPYDRPGSVTLTTFAVFLAACLLAAAALAVLAVFRVRAVALRHAGGLRVEKERLRARMLPIAALPGPSLDGNPVLWREWHRRRPSRWARVIWAVYVLGAVVATGLALAEFLAQTGPRRDESLAIVGGVIVAVGLLLLSVHASTSLAEERVRGSLDVLLATPLPTSAILWGKWWGAFRTVPWLAALPVLGAVCAALRGGNGTVPVAVAMLVLAYGAAITSLGLALATWVPRLGRAVGLSVTAYVAATVGWVLVAVTLSSSGPRRDVYGPGIAMGSPFYGVAFAVLVAGEGGPDEFRDAMPAFALFWTFAYGAAAAGLFAATRATFGRCLGRIEECAAPVAGPGRSRAKPEPVGDLGEITAA